VQAVRGRVKQSNYKKIMPKEQAKRKPLFSIWCHSRMLLAGISCVLARDAKQKYSGMTKNVAFLDSPTSRIFS
jgi:hypothetical protein